MQLFIKSKRAFLQKNKKLLMFFFKDRLSKFESCFLNFKFGDAVAVTPKNKIYHVKLLLLIFKIAQETILVSQS